MATMTGKEEDVVRMLKNLIELDYDAVEAYQAAIARLEDRTSREALADFMNDHLRHTRDLSEVVHQMGAVPPKGGDFKRVLTKGKVVIGNIIGDRGVLMAMKSNEDDTNTAYERVAKRTDLSPELLALVQRNLADERRHRAWIVERLDYIREAREEPRPPP
jgi:uncharacterized protein (TIGR02284 family)